jgi:hypothetical protein
MEQDFLNIAELKKQHKKLFLDSLKEATDARQGIASKTRQEQNSIMNVL